MIKKMRTGDDTKLMITSILLLKYKTIISYLDMYMTVRGA